MAEKKVYNVMTRGVAAVERRARRGGVSVSVSVGGGSSAGGGYVDMSGYLPRSEFDEMFERVVTGVDAAGNEIWHTRVKRDFLGDGRIAAVNGGGGESSGGESPGGESTGGCERLADLLDVGLRAPLAEGEALVWRDGAWRNEAVAGGIDEGALGRYLSGHGYVTSGVLSGYALRGEIPDLGGYATEDWVLGCGFVSDVSHLLERSVFDEMFERVERADGSWYIRAKADVLGDGRITAVNGGGESSGGESTGGCERLADLLDVGLRVPLADGEALVWRDGAWRNEAVAGGIDEAALGRYLSGHGYVTSGALGDYVTVDTAQTIRGQKRFEANETFFSGRITVNGTNADYSGCPEVMWHIPNVAYVKIKMDGSRGLHVLDGDDESWRVYRPIAAGAFVRYGGTSAQFLKADGSVDEHVYFCQDLGNIPLEYINLADYSAGAAGYANYQSGVYTVPLSGHSGLFVNFAKNHSSTSALQLFTDWYDDAPLLFRKTVNGTRVGGPWRTIVTELNIGDYMVENASRLDSRFVNVSGDTMTGPLNFAKGESDFSLIKGVYDAAGNKSNVIWCDGNGRVIYGSPHFSKVVLESSNSYVVRQTAGVEYKIWDAGNDGSGSGLDADMLDGLHGDDFVRRRADMWSNGESVSEWSKRVVSNPGIYSMTHWAWADSAQLSLGGYTIDRMRYSAIDFRSGNLNAVWQQKAFLFLPTYTDSSMIYIAQMSTVATAGVVTTSVKRYADYDTIINGNVASATKLQTARKIFGVNFNGDADVSGRFELNGVTNGTFSIYDGGTYRALQTWGNAQLCINPQGNGVCIGTTANSSGARLHVNGNIYAAGQITGTNTSDERLKENIRPIEGAVGLLRGLGGFFVFDYRVESGESMRCGRIGLIYQNVRGHFAGLMGLRREDGYGALNYIAPDFINLIGASVLEVDGRVAGLEREIADLRRENEALRGRVDSIDGDGKERRIG